MLTENCRPIELAAVEVDMLAESEPTPPQGGSLVMGNQSGVSVVGIRGDSVVIGTTQPGLDDRPHVMARLQEECPDCPGVDVLVQDEAHLGNR